MRSGKAFGPYINLPELTTQIFNIGRSFWSAKCACDANPNALAEVDYASGYYPLCSFCLTNEDCPKFVNKAVLSQWEPAVEKLDSLKMQKSGLEQEIKETEDALKQVFKQSANNGWVTAGQHRFKVSEVKGRQSLDMNLIREELEAIFDGYGVEDTVDGFLNRCVKIGAPYERLVVNRIN